MLVWEVGIEHSIQVVETSLVPPAWMGPVEQEAVVPQDDQKAAQLALRADNGKLVEGTCVLGVACVSRVTCHVQEQARRQRRCSFLT